MVMIEQCVSAPVTSEVIPPVGSSFPPDRSPNFVLSFVVRSGLMIIHWSPRFSEREEMLGAGIDDAGVVR